MIERIKQDNRMSQAVIFGAFFESAGQVADDPSADITGQTEQVLAQIDGLLSQANYTKSDLTRVQVWMKSMEDFATMNAVYERWLEDSDKPVRAAVEAKLADPQYLVEIQVFAFRG